MTLIPLGATDADLIAYIDRWAALLEREEYDAAFTHTDHVHAMGWTPNLIRDVIAAYGDAEPGQRVTLGGEPTDVQQRKSVTRHPDGSGYVWYDLNINGFASDLTATFDVEPTARGFVVRLSDIHVM